MNPDILKIHGDIAKDKTAVPETIKQIGKCVWHGKRDKRHTLIIPVAVPIVELPYYRIDVLGDGKELDVKEGEVHSWVRNFYNMMCSQCSGGPAQSNVWGDGNINVKDTGGTVRRDNTTNRPISQEYNNLEGAVQYGYRAIKANDSAGIVVGTDNTPVDVDNDYALVAQVAHATLQHGAELMPKPDAYADGYHSLSLGRYFDNFSGGAITIQEMAIYSYMRLNVLYYVMLARDVIPDGGLEIPDKAQARVIYTLSLAIPSSGSPLRNFYNQVITHAMALNGDDNVDFANGYMNFKQTDTTLNVQSHPVGFASGANISLATNGYRGNTGIATHGIVVGNNAAEVTFNDYVLAGPIAHGVLEGQLNYAAGSSPAGSWADPVYTVSHVREMTNGSGSNVTVRECGIIGEFDGAFMALTCRDVFSDVVVANGESIEVTYQFQVTFP